MSTCTIAFAFAGGYHEIVLTSNQVRLLAAFVVIGLLLLAAMVGALLVRSRDVAPHLSPTPQPTQGNHSPTPDGGPGNSPHSVLPTAAGSVTMSSTASINTPTETLSAAPTDTTSALADSPAPTQTLSLTLAFTPEPTPLPPAVVLDASGNGPGSTAEVTLPPGVYRVFFTSGVFGASVAPDVIDGYCSETPLIAGTAVPEESASYRSTGCRVRFDVAGVPGGWALRVETATLGGLLTPPAAFSGIGSTTTELVDLPEGEYLIAFNTSSPYSMVTPIVVGGPCLERPIIMLTAPAQLEATYPSLGCQVVFQVSGVTASWELAVTRIE